MSVMLRWTLNSLIGELEDLKGESLSLRRLSQETNISYPAIHRIASNDAGRIDTSTLDRLLKYFNQHMGRPVTAADLLQYEEDEEEPESEE